MEKGNCGGQSGSPGWKKEIVVASLGHPTHDNLAQRVLRLEECLWRRGPPNLRAWGLERGPGARHLERLQKRIGLCGVYKVECLGDG